MTELTLAHEIFRSVIEAGFLNMDARHVDMHSALWDAMEAGEISEVERAHCVAVIQQYTNGFDIFGALRNHDLDNSHEAIRAIFNDWDNRPNLKK